MGDKGKLRHHEWPGRKREITVSQLSRAPRDGRRLGTRVYETIRDRIVDGELGPDTQLVQEQLAETLGVSRTPVRDALNQLAHEGLVTWVQGVGYIVNDLTEQDITDVYQVRYTLELLAVRLACGRHDRAQLARLRGLIEEMAAEEPTATAQHFDLNRRFHLSLIEPCGNHLLTQLIDNLWDHPVNRRITRSYVHDQENVGQMVTEHRAILSAAEAGDADRLVALVGEHMVRGYGETIPGEVDVAESAGVVPPAVDRP